MNGTEQIVAEYQFPEPPAQVWRALTEPELLAKWLMPNDIAPIVGHKFQFRAQPIGNWNGIVDCEVLEVVPNQRLVYTWMGGAAENLGYGHVLETTVTWTLQERPDGGTILSLVHYGFRPDDFAFHAMSQGWASKGPAIAGAMGTVE